MSDMEKIHQRRQQLELKVAELEQTLAAMKAKLEQLEEAEQHEMVNHLEESLEEVEERYSHLKDFGNSLLSDLKKLLHLP